VLPWKSNVLPMKSASIAALAFAAATLAAAQDAPRTVYRCPGPPVLYTDALTDAEAKARNCRTIEGAPVTVLQGPRRKPAPGAGAASGAGEAAPAASVARIDPAAQRARDTDSRRILESELLKEEQALAELKREFNNGEPERRGDERNYAKYLERVSEMKASIARKESDIAALKREIAKLPS
jgi:hypothetical protein